MNITENAVSNFIHKKLVYKPNTYPQCLNTSLPRNYFVALFIGSRGTGKTYSVCQLLKQYELAGFDKNQAMRVIVFSPTHDANPVFNCLKIDPSDIVNDYSDSKLLEVIEDIKQEKQNTAEYKKDLQVWSKFFNGKIDALTFDEIDFLERTAYQKPTCRYPNGAINYFVLDDLVGSSAFKSVGKSVLTNLVLKNRHLGINIMICSQNLKAIPKSIRTNTSLFVLFKFASTKILVDLHDEVSSTLTLKKFERLYIHATQDEHDSLVIDFTGDKLNRFKKNFDIVLNLQ